MRIFLIILFSLLTFWLKAQEFVVEGTLQDSLETPVPYATATLLNPQDSVMRYFGISNKEGRFKMKKVEQGDYLLQVAYLGFDTYYREVSIKGDLNLETIVLKEKSTTLAGAEVTAEQIPILIKKDTVEYNAGSFKVKKDADVEELLSRLPGIEVDEDGKIKAQGKEVNKVLVDGKEFFGDDPKMATKNLPADAINKVQVYDKKSDAAEFTGVDDGERNKTINLKLKEDRKKGYFGNISAGYGTDNRYESKLNINRFTKKYQLSTIGQLNNTNQSGFSFGESVNFAGGMSRLMSGGSFNIGGGLPINRGAADGFTRTGAIGANLNTDIGKKTKLTASYFYNDVLRESESSSARQDFIGESTFFTDEISEQENRNANHRASLRLKSDLDSMQRLVLSGNLTFNDSEFQSNSFKEVFTAARLLENDSDRKNSSQSNNLNFDLMASYMLKFKKKGRSASLEASLNNNNSSSEGLLQSLNRLNLLEPDNTIVEDLLQNQEENQGQLGYKTRLNYVEPLGKKRYAEFAYEHRNRSTESERNVFDVLPTPVYNPDFSNAFNNDYFYNVLGFNFRKNRESFKYSLGLDVQQSTLKGDIITQDIQLERNFRFLLPKATMQMQISQSQNWRMNYSTQIREPSLNELQPVVNNNDPLNQYLGNPNLNPEYTHRLNTSYNLFDQFSFTSLFVFATATLTKDKIVRSQTIDSLFRRTTIPLNVEDVFDARINASFSTPLKFMGAKLRLRAGLNFVEDRVVLNEVESGVDRWRNTLGISFSNLKRDKFNLRTGVDYTFNTSRFEDESQGVQRFLNQRYYLTADTELGKWQLDTKFNYTIYSGQAFEDTTQLPIWSASVSRYMLKGDKGQLKLSVFDLLNQNRGINRSSSLNYIQDERVNSLGRYFLLTFTYKIKGFGGNDRGIRIRMD